MLRTLAIVAAFALTATAASAQKIDANGKCHGPDGKFAKKEVCAGATAAPAGVYKLDAKGGCHAADGKMAKKEMCAGMTPPAAKTADASKADKTAKVVKTKK